MKKSLLVPAIGVAALALSVTLAGCGSGSKTASSSSASAASTAASSAASESSTATDTARKLTLTLPELPGWTPDPEDELKADETSYMVAYLSSGESYGAGDPVPLTMSGFDGYKGVFNCDSGGSQILGSLAIPQTADTPPTILNILGDTGSSTDAAPVEEAFNLITSEGTIVP